MTKVDPKAKLADAFIELAHRDGAFRITLEAVAKKAKLPFSTAHYHLKSTGLPLVEFGLREVSARGQRFTVAYLERAVRENPDANPLHQYIEVTHAWAREEATLATLWLFHYHLASVDERVRREYQPFLQAAVGRIEKLIYECVGRGIYPAPSEAGGYSVPELALTLHILFVGSLQRGLIGAPTPAAALTENEAICRRTADKLLSGESRDRASRRSAD